MQLNIKEVHGPWPIRGREAALNLSQARVWTFIVPAKCQPGDGKGKRFRARMIDGGRTKIRTTKRKAKKAGARPRPRKRRFRTDWRETETNHRVRDGRTRPHEKKGTKSIIDGTFEGPDAILEVLALRFASSRCVAG